MSQLYERRFRIEIYNPGIFAEQIDTAAKLTVPTKTSATIGQLSSGIVHSSLPTIADLLAKSTKASEVGIGAMWKKIDDKLRLSRPKLKFDGYYNDDGKWGFTSYFDIQHSIDEQAGGGNVEIMNLSEDSYRQIHKGDIVNVFAGYRRVGMQQLIFGTVQKLERPDDGLDVSTKISVTESGDWWPVTTAWREGEPNEKATQVIAQLLEMLPINYVFKGVGFDKTYPRGIIFDQKWTVMMALGHMARETRSKVYVQNGSVIVEPLKAARPMDIKITPYAPYKNMVGKLQKLDIEENASGEEADWRLTTYLDGRIQPGVAFWCDCPQYRGWLRAISVRYVGSESEWYVVADCAEHDQTSAIESLGPYTRFQMMMIQGRLQVMYDLRDFAPEKKAKPSPPPSDQKTGISLKSLVEARR